MKYSWCLLIALSCLYGQESSPGDAGDGAEGRPRSVGEQAGVVAVDDSGHDPDAIPAIDFELYFSYQSAQGFVVVRISPRQRLASFGLQQQVWLEHDATVLAALRAGLVALRDELGDATAIEEEGGEDLVRCFFALADGPLQKISTSSAAGPWRRRLDDLFPLLDLPVPAGWELPEARAAP